MSNQSQDVFSRIDREKDEYLEELKSYLRIPSVSTDPDFRGDVLRCAEFLRQKMEDAGLTARLIETDGHPLVYGEWLNAPGQPTILFYGHYDVQPPDPPGSVAQPTLRAHHRGRRAGRPRSNRRQGPELCPPEGGSGDPGRAWILADQREVHRRGRRRVRW